MIPESVVALKAVAISFLEKAHPDIVCNLIHCFGLLGVGSEPDAFKRGN